MERPGKSRVFMSVALDSLFDILGSGLVADQKFDNSDSPLYTYCSYLPLEDKSPTLIFTMPFSTLTASAP